MAQDIFSKLGVTKASRGRQEGAVLPKTAAYLASLDAAAKSGGKIGGFTAPVDVTYEKDGKNVTVEVSEASARGHLKRWLKDNPTWKLGGSGTDGSGRTVLVVVKA